MRLEVPVGKYVVAVSGGVDSMALLSLLCNQPDVTLVVAHYDHGIRPDSYKDCLLVRQTAEAYGLAFTSETGQLGANASEATARAARYKFLHRVKQVAGAKAIVLAHHQDDVLETMIINLLRGTGRKGLSSLQSNHDLLRPLLKFPKSQIVAYARHRHVTWREDSTNTDTDYLRNYIRHQLLSSWTDAQKQDLLSIGDRMKSINAEIDGCLEPLLTVSLRRDWFNNLSNVMALEVMAAWLRKQGITDFNRLLLQQIVVAAKVGRAGSVASVGHNYQLHIAAEQFILLPYSGTLSAVKPRLALRVQER